MYRSTIFRNSGKWYWEVEIGNNQYTTIGIIDDEYSMGSYTNVGQIRLQICLGITHIMVTNITVAVGLVTRLETPPLRAPLLGLR